MKRSIRRHHAKRVKARARRIITNVWGMSRSLTEAQITAKAAKLATYKVCSCGVCKKARYEREPFDARAIMAQARVEEGHASIWDAFWEEHPYMEVA